MRVKKTYRESNASVSPAIRTDLSVSALGRPASGRPAHGTAARRRPVGEAWLLSDRDDHPSRVADGPLKGQTIGQLLEQSPEQLLGKLAGRFRRFPLLLKFLDAHEMLSVQVHPADAQRTAAGGRDGQDRSLGRAGGGAGKPHLRGLEARHHCRRSAAGARERGGGGPPRMLHAEGRRRRLRPAGTVHSLGGDVVVFEVQENSDVTFSLYDWDHVDPKTGKRRPCKSIRRLPALISARCDRPGDARGGERRRRSSASDSFIVNISRLWRQRGQSPFTRRRGGYAAGAGMHRRRRGRLEHHGANYAVGKGDVLLLPAVVGACHFSAATVQ